MKKQNIMHRAPDVGFIEAVENYENIFKMIDSYEEKSAFLKKKSKIPSPKENISAKEFLDIINNFNPYKNEIYIMPSDNKFKTLIEEIHKLKAPPKQKACIILYSVIKQKSFKFQNISIAIICFIYFLAKNNLTDIKRFNNEYEKKNLFLITLIIEKSSASERNEILNLIEKIILSV